MTAAHIRKCIRLTKRHLADGEEQEIEVNGKIVILRKHGPFVSIEEREDEPSQAVN